MIENMFTLLTSNAHFSANNNQIKKENANENFLVAPGTRANTLRHVNKVYKKRIREMRIVERGRSLNTLC